ncbi:MAG: hypothetical protein HQ558_02255 [Candidatus Omnitrophica bacterium]|nr:hypothetical protein [Candidatus Omnitrophota bacterium]
MKRIIILLIIASTILSGCVSAKVDEISERWKKEKNVEDFIWLKDNCLKKGMSTEEARRLLGKPLNIYMYDSKQRWLYIKCDTSKNQFYAWSIIFDSKKKLKEIYRKGIE